MPAYAELQKRQDALIRKAMEGSIFIGLASAPEITAMTQLDTAELMALPSGYEDAGMINKDDGLAWARSVETSDVTSWGFAEPTRRDITSAEKTVQFTMQETKKLSLEMYHGLDLTPVTPAATTGEVTFDEPQRPATRYYRAFGLYQDGEGANAIYVGRWMPKASVTDLGDQTWADGDDPVAHQVTLTAYHDATAGCSMRHFFGGPGWRDLLEDMGFPAMPTGTTTA